MENDVAKLLAELRLLDLITPEVVDTGSQDTKLTAEEHMLYKKLHNTYTGNKKSPKTKELFDSIYDKAENPYELALKFHVSGVNYQNCKAASFTFYVLEAFNAYVKTRPEKHSMLDDQLKTKAFHLTNKDPNGSVFKQVSEAYRFTESAHLFEPHVRTLMQNHQYVDAARFALHCGVVHDDFVFGFLLPISFDRQVTSALYEYLEFAKALQNPLMKVLDSMMIKNGDEKIRSMFQYYKYKDIPAENLSYDYLKKNIPKLQKRFNTDPSVIPNSAYKQSVDSLIYWIIKFSTGEVSPISFENKVHSMVHMDNADLQLVLLSQLLRHNMDLQAIHWILYFNIEIQRLPAYIQKKLGFYMGQNQNVQQQ